MFKLPLDTHVGGVVVVHELFDALYVYTPPAQLLSVEYHVTSNVCSALGNVCAPAKTIHTATKTITNVIAPYSNIETHVRFLNNSSKRQFDSNEHTTRAQVFETCMSTFPSLYFVSFTWYLKPQPVRSVPHYSAFELVKLKTPSRARIGNLWITLF